MKNNFESSPLKHEIRRVICDQIIQTAKAQKRNELFVSSLPGRFWHFESRLHALADVNNLSLNLGCVELDKEIFNSGNPYVDVADGQNENRIGNHLFRYDNEPFTFNGGTSEITWADYCGIPRQEFLNDFISWANNRDSWGIGYVTFCLSVRASKGESERSLPPELLKNWRNETWQENAEAVVHYIAERIKVPFRHIFFQLYRHCGQGSQTMLTFGVEIRPNTRTKAKVKPFESIQNFPPSSVPVPFNDSALAVKVYYHRRILCKSAKDTAQACGITSKKLGGVRVSKLYKAIVKKNLYSTFLTIKSIDDVIIP